MKIKTIQEPKTLLDDRINELGEQFEKVEKKLQKSYDKALGRIRALSVSDGSAGISKYFNIDKRHIKP